MQRMLNYSTSKVPLTEMPAFTFNRDYVEMMLRENQHTVSRLESEYGLGGRNYLDYYKAGELCRAKVLVTILSEYLQTMPADADAQ